MMITKRSASMKIKEGASLGIEIIPEEPPSANWLEIFSLRCNANADRHVCAIILAIGDLCVGIALERAVYRRVLVNLESHGFRRGCLRRKLLTWIGGLIHCDIQSKGILINRGNLSRDGLQLMGALLFGGFLPSLRHVWWVCCPDNCRESQAGYSGKNNSPYILHRQNLLVGFDWA